MIFHIPERIFDYIKNNRKFMDYENRLQETLGWDSFDYTEERVQGETEAAKKLYRYTMEAAKDAPDAIRRELRIMLRCTNVEYLEKSAENDPDVENKLCSYYQLTNCNVSVKENKNKFLYAYSKLTMQSKKLLSSTMHNVFYIFKGEKIIADATSVRDAVEDLLELRRRVLQVPCKYHDKLEKTTSVEFIAHLFFTYCRFRKNITKEETDLLIDKCTDMGSWCEKVYDDVWLGNFRTAMLLYSVLLDRLQEKASGELVKNAFHMLASYLVSSFSDRANTIKSLTTHNEDFRARYIVLVGACIRLLNYVDKNYVETNIMPLVGEEEKKLAIEPSEDSDSDTPISDNIIKKIGYENESTKSIQFFENEVRKGFEFLEKTA